MHASTQSPPVYPTSNARSPETVVHLGVPAPALADALDRAGIDVSIAQDVGAAAALVARLGRPTLLVPVERWGEMRAHAGRAVIVADRADDRSTFAALDGGADDVVYPDDDRESLRAVLSREPGERPTGDGAAAQIPRLAQLSAEVAKIARALDGLAQAEPASDPSTVTSPALKLNAPQVRALIRARRDRNRFFAADLFADPAWDILLDLMASRLEGRQVSVSSLCIAAAVPATTALRWIKSMTDADLLQRTPDPIDGRRVFIDLSPKAVEAMNAYMASTRGVVPV